MKKIIVITGGGSGLGKAVATLLSKDHQVIILSRREDELKKVSEETRQKIKESSFRKGKPGTMTGRKHSEETKAKMRKPKRKLSSLE